MAHVVLLGDSIFDNRAYVSEGFEVAIQLRRHLGDAHNVTSCARDGSVLADMPAQFSEVAVLRDVPTHLVISCGGNDVLGLVGAMQSSVASVLEATEMLAAWRADFQRDYRTMLQQAQACGIPFAVCTIYDSIPGLSPGLRGALALFNDVILREAVMRAIPVLDLRLVCTAAADYSGASPIEPSAEGGRKIAAGLAELVLVDEREVVRTVVFGANVHRYGAAR